MPLVAEVVDHILEAVPMAVLVLVATVTSVVAEQLETAQLILGPVAEVVEIITAPQAMAVMAEKE
jgi:hypothetical protein